LGQIQGSRNSARGPGAYKVRPVGGNIKWLARAVWVVGEGARSLALICRLRVRPVWDGENVMAMEQGASHEYVKSDRSGSARM
ncbi:MAG: hypothetical protein ACKPKO_49720, partial [Candidatus Fonsibacter sp.]